MSKKRETLLGIIILVLVIVSGVVFSTIKSDMLHKSENHEKMQEVAKEVLVSEEADSVVEAPTEKVFTYWGESNDVSVYLMEPEKNQYPAIEMGEGNYRDQTLLYGADGRVTQINNILEFQHLYNNSCILAYNEVFEKKDGTYRWTDKTFGNALDLKSILGYSYFQESKIEFGSDILLFCGIIEEFETTVLIRKNLQTNKETHYYFDDYYKACFSKTAKNPQSSYVYLTRRIVGENKYKKLEIWKYNFYDNTMKLIDSIDETYDYAYLATNDSGDIFVLFALFEEKSWGIFLDTKKTFEIPMRSIDVPFFSEQGVYMYLDSWLNEDTKTHDIREGLYFFERDGDMIYIGNDIYGGTICDDLIIAMQESESINAREMYISFLNIREKNSELTKIFYPPKYANNKTYYMVGWSYENDTIYGYYVSEDCADVEKFVVN